jgi:O-succinylbenzoic acid--CoA ligase
MSTRTISDVVNRAEHQLGSINPDAPFLYTATKMLSYRKFSIWAQLVAQQLQEAAYITSDSPVIALRGRPDPTMLSLIAAGWMLGWKIIPLSPDWSASEINTRLQKLDVKVCISEDEDEVTEALDLPIIHFEDLPDPAAITYDMGTVWSDEEWNTRRFEQPHDIFGYFFTSGTTGEPKCVPLRRRQMLSAALDALPETKLDHGEAWLHVLPIQHIGGYSLILRSLLYGGTVYAQPSGFETEEVARLLAEDERITVTSLVPTMLRRLLAIEDFTVHERFQSILMGGAPTSPDLIEEAVERGIPLTVSYGMTETCAQIAAHSFIDEFDLSDPLDTVGHLFSSNKISIRIDLTDHASQDGNGRIWLRGPQVITEYLDPKHTQEAFDEEGWFNTGDIGHTDDDGRLYIASRRSDLIISGGENVRPQHIENAILRNIESIDACVVVGMPDEEWGQRVVAVCVSDPDETELPPAIEELRARLRDDLQPYELPRAVAYVSELPRTASGKVKRAEILEQLNQGSLDIDHYENG